MHYEFHIETIKGRLIRIEKCQGMDSQSFAEFYLPSITREEMIRLVIFNDDEPGNPVGIVLFKR
jgi:hypothetical protein